MIPLHSFKPGASKAVHLFTAPFIWTCVGIMLVVRGFGWIGPGFSRWLIVLGIFLGMAKSFAVLDKVARKNIERISRMKDKTCLGAVYTWKTWLMVAMMMGFGIALRTLTELGRIVGTIYVAIGWALLFSSRHGWKSWAAWIHRD